MIGCLFWAGYILLLSAVFVATGDWIVRLVLTGLAAIGAAILIALAEE